MTNAGISARNQPRRRTDEVRQLLLDAAERVISREGAERATVTAIAREAGVAVSRLYKHFGSREDLLHQAMQVPLAQFMQRWRHALPLTEAPADDLEVMQLFVETIYHAAVEHRGLIQTLLLEIPGGGDRFVAGLTPSLTSALDELEAIAREHARQQDIDEGVIPAGLRAVITLALTAAVFGPAYLGAEDDAGLLDRLARFSAYGIRQQQP